jgi:hypothetical protein
MFAEFVELVKLVKLGAFLTNGIRESIVADDSLRSRALIGAVKAYYRRFQQMIEVIKTNPRLQWSVRRP